MRSIPCGLQHYCDETQQQLEDKYLLFSEAEPWRQSGMSGPMDRWTSLRKPIADCVDRDESFLDLCCANGLLVHCTGPRDGAEESMREAFSLDLLNQVGHKIGYGSVHNKEVYVAIILKRPPNKDMPATPNGAPDG